MLPVLPIFRILRGLRPAAWRPRQAGGGARRLCAERLEPRTMLSGDYKFATALGAGGGTDNGQAIAVDATGNAYVTGDFLGLVDFDPGAGTTWLDAGNGRSAFVAKYSSSGALVWARQLTGATAARGCGIALDQDANVLLAGHFSGTADFDPGTGTSLLSSPAGASDAFVWKLNLSGEYVYAKQLGGASYDYAYAIAVDAAGNTYTTGQFSGTADFDPGAGTAALVSAGSNDIFVCQLDAAGNFVYAKQLGGTGDDCGYAIAVDGLGRVSTTGKFTGTADFDPGPTTVALSSVGDSSDIFVSQLDAAGGFVYANQFGSTSNEQANGITTDAAGNVYATGRFLGTVDFDPGAETANLTSYGGADAFVLKLDASGAYGWARQLGGMSDDAGYGITVNNSGNVCTVGQFISLAQFDPLAEGNAELFSAGSSDVYVSVLNASGAYVYAGAMGGLYADVGYAIATDASGNLYTTGGFQDVADFDPGAAARTLATASATDTDIFVSKLTGAGGFTYAARAGSASVIDDTAQAVSRDASGNIYVTGAFQGTVDFDPGPSVVALGSAGGEDVFVAKYDPFGGLLWVRHAGATGADRAVGIAVDGAGNVLTTGQFFGTVDFDPGAGTSSLTSSGTSNIDIFVWKLTASGDFVYAQRFGNASAEIAGGIAVDALGNALTTGTFVGTVDFDPGAGTANLVSSGGTDIFVSKLDPAGNFSFAKKLGGSSADTGNAIAVDSSANVYTTGSFAGTADFDPGTGVATLTSAGNSDVFVSKLDGSGNYVYSKRVGGTTADNGNGITVDAAGGAFITGSFSGTADFDPGTGTVNLVSAGSVDAYVCKLDASGNYGYARQLGGTADDYGRGVAVDSAGNVYVAGYFSGTADFDPSASTANLVSFGLSDAFVGKLNASGAYVYARQFGGSMADYGYGVACDDVGDVFVVGQFAGTADFDPGAGTVNLTSHGGFDTFLVKLADDVVNPSATISYPVDGATYAINDWGVAITGTASDGGGSGLRSVQVSLRRAGGKYWDGSGFRSTAEVFFTASGTDAWTWNFLRSRLITGGDFVVHARAIDMAWNTAEATATFSIEVPPGGRIVGRYLAYNNSAWDGFDDDATEADYDALAPAPSITGHGHAGALDEPAKELGKQALLPGQTATFVNYSSFAKGINEIVIVVDRVADAEAITAADFVFRVGNDNAPAGWAAAPAPQSVSVAQFVDHPDFPNYPDVLTITWADENPFTPLREPGAISNQWLEVTVLSTARTGLPFDDVFYFGNQIGESGNSAADTNVDQNDEIGARNHPHTAFNAASISDPYDFDRDGKVDQNDEIITRNSPATAFTRISLITAPEMLQAAAGGVASAEPALAMSEAAPLIAAAVARWDAADPAGSAARRLAQTQFVVADLAGRKLAEASLAANVVYLDANAAGHGWFLDATPEQDEEFAVAAGSSRRATAGTAADERIDLLTAVMHEMGHVLGRPDADQAADDLMAATLPTGLRRSV